MKFNAAISVVTSAILALAIGLVAPPAHSEPHAGAPSESVGVTLLPDKPTSTTDDASRTLTAKASVPLVEGQSVSIYKNGSTRLATCAMTRSKPCATLEVRVTPAVDTTEHYIAYVHTGAAPASTTPPAESLLAEATTTIEHLGWLGDLSLEVTDEPTPFNNRVATVTVESTVPVGAPYRYSLYRDGKLIASCQTCGTKWSRSVMVDDFTDSLITAYVAVDYPTSGPPTERVRAQSSVNLRNAGWQGAMTVGQAYYGVDAQNPTANIKLGLSQALPPDYRVYQSMDDGQSWTAASAPTTELSLPFTAQHHQTVNIRYVVTPGQSPLRSGRILAEANTTVTHMGWLGSLNVHAPESVANTVRPKITGSFSQPLAGVQVYMVEPGVSGVTVLCLNAPRPILSCSHDQREFAVDLPTVPHGGSLTREVFVAPAGISGTESAIRAAADASSLVTVRDAGWSGTVSLEASQTTLDESSPSVSFTARTSEPFAHPYRLVIYDWAGTPVGSCQATTRCADGYTYRVNQAIDKAFAYRTPLTYTAHLEELDSQGTWQSVASSQSTIVHLGWSGSISMSRLTDPTYTEPVAKVRVETSKPVAGTSFAMRVVRHDDDRLAPVVGECRGWIDWFECNYAGDYTLDSHLEVGEPATYEAVVIDLRDPTKVTRESVHASSGTLEFENPGWYGSLRMIGSGEWRKPEVRPAIGRPYIFSVYSTDGRLLGQCDLGLANCRDSGVWLPKDARDMPAIGYIALDAPDDSFPTKGVRAISGQLASVPPVAGSTAVAGGSNPSRPCIQICHADPVNSATGELWETSDDLGVEGHLTSPLQRTYSAIRASEKGILGYGWYTFLDARVDSIARGSLGEFSEHIVTQENGSTVRFMELSDGTLHPENGANASLTRDADGAFILTRASGDHVSFTPDGVPTGIRLGSRTWKVKRDAGKPVAVVSTDGQRVDLRWQGSNLEGWVGTGDRVVEVSRDEQGNLTKVSRPDGSSVRYEYTGDHLMSVLVHPNGGRTTNTFDAQGRVTKQVDPIGRSHSFSYGPLLTTVTKPDGTVSRENYNSGGQLAAVTQAYGTPLAATFAYSYDTAGRLTGVTKPGGSATTYTYTPEGLLASVSDAAGRTETVKYDAQGRETSRTTGNGFETTTRYDGNGDIRQVTLPNGTVTTFSEGAPEKVKDALGRLSIYTSSGLRRPDSLTSPAGDTTSWTYSDLGLTATTRINDLEPMKTEHDKAGRPTAVTDQHGNVTRYEYDPSGRVKLVIDASGGRWEMAYDLGGQLTSEKSPDGSTTRYTYDAMGRVETITDPLGHAVSLEYDAHGNRTAIVDQLAQRTTYRYNGAQQLVESQDPTGRVGKFTYDAAGRIMSVTHPSSGTTSYKYNAADLVTKETTADGRETTYEYDDQYNLVKKTYPDSSTESWTYNQANEVTSHKQGDNHTAYEYNGGGQVQAITRNGATTKLSYTNNEVAAVERPDGSEVVYTRDNVGRITHVDHPGTASDVTMQYTPLGELSAMADAAGTSTFTYDEMNRVTRASTPSGDINYSHDANSNVTEIIYPGNQKVSRDYNAAGLLTRVTDWADNTYDMTWNASQELTRVARPNGTADERTYAPNGNLAGLSVASDATSILDIKLDYTTNSLLSTLETTRTNAVSHSGYEWDQRDRLTSTGPGDIESFAHSDSGRVARLSGVDLIYNELGQLTSTSNDMSFTYDGRGNRATTQRADDVISQMAWTSDDRLESAALDGKQHQYTYFADGLRATATDGSRTDEFLWNRSGLVPTLLGDSEHWFIYGIGSQPLAQIDRETGDTEQLHGDMLGSIRSVTNDNGAQVAAADYTPYGTVMDVQGVDAAHTVTRFGFAGEYTDPTGLVYLRDRYYEPGTAQFLSVDRLVDITKTAYGYTNGNPLQYVDPLGLWGWPWNWTGDEWGTVSAVTGVVSLGLYATGVGAPVAGLLSSVSTATGIASTVLYAKEGDLVGAGVASIGLVPAAGAVLSKALARSAVEASKATGNGLRSAGREHVKAAVRLNYASDMIAAKNGVELGSDYC